MGKNAMITIEEIKSYADEHFYDGGKWIYYGFKDDEEILEEFKTLDCVVEFCKRMKYLYPGI